MALNDIIVPRENAQGLFDERVLTPADIAAAPATGIAPSAISGTAVVDNDARLTNSRTPTAHASSHATGGSDPVSAFSIGAESIFDTSGETLSGTPVTLTASRARVWTFPCVSATTVTLPTTGVELGDRIVVRGGVPVLAAISISSTQVSDTIQNTGEQFSYTYLGTGTGNRWVKNLVDNHDAARVNSGTFDNARINFASPPAIGNTTPNTLAGTQLALHDGSDTGTFVVASKLTANRTYDLPDASGTIALTTLIGAPCEFIIACSDESTNLTTGTAKVTFRAPYAFTLTAVRASVNTAPTGSTLIVDINNGANSALSTKLSIDASEKTSTTAATAAVIDTDYDNFSDDAEITIDIDQVGSTIAGKGLKVTLIGTRA